MPVLSTQGLHGCAPAVSTLEFSCDELDRKSRAGSDFAGNGHSGVVVFHGISSRGLGAQTGKAHSVIFESTAAKEAASYNVYRGTKSGGPYDTKLDSHHRHHSVNSPVTAGTYYYVVTSVRKNGKESRYSEEIKVVVVD